MATSFLKLQNNGQSTLYNTITSSQTTLEIPIGHTSRFPGSNSFIIEVSTEDVNGNITAYETMLVTSVSSNTFTVTRGYDSTTAIAWTAGALVKNKIRSEHFSSLQTAVNVNENKLDGVSTGIILNTPIVRNWDGWIEANITWTYASATTFTVAGDLTSLFNVGDKIKLTQTTVKYFYVISRTFASGNTTVTISGGSDYTLTNAAITSNYYSKAETPNGFPKVFNYVVAWTAGATNPVIGNGTTSGKFRLSGVFCTTTLQVQAGSTTTFGSGSYYLSVPITSSTSNIMQSGNAVYVDNGVQQYFGTVRLDANSSTLYCFYSLNSPTTSVAPFTFGNGDILSVNITYLTSL